MSKRRHKQAAVAEQDRGFAKSVAEGFSDSMAKQGPPLRGVVLAVGLRAEKDVRQCTPFMMRVVDGQVVEAHEVHEPEDAAFALARCQDALEQVAIDITEGRWPPKAALYQLPTAEKARLAKMVSIDLRRDTGLPEPEGADYVVPDHVPGAIAFEVRARYSTWRKSVQKPLLAALKRHGKQQVHVPEIIIDPAEGEEQPEPRYWVEDVRAELRVEEGLEAWQWSVWLYVTELDPRSGQELGPDEPPLAKPVERDPLCMSQLMIAKEVEL